MFFKLNKIVLICYIILISIIYDYIPFDSVKAILSLSFFAILPIYNFLFINFINKNKELLHKYYLIIFNLVNIIFFCVLLFLLITITFSFKLDYLIIKIYSVLILGFFFINPFLIAKFLVSYEKGKEAKLNEFVGDYLLFFMFFIGFWFTLPRMNKILELERNSNFGNAPK